MSKQRVDLYVCNDVIERSDELLEKNFVKFHKYAEHQETLRLKFIETNSEYKFIKTWLHTAYEDIIMLKSEQGNNLTQFYEELLKDNWIEEFLDYVNSREKLQSKFIEAMNEFKNLKTSLDVANNDIMSLKLEYDNFTRRYDVLLENDFVIELLDRYANEQETLRLKFIEIIDKCNRLSTCLDSANEAVVVMNSEHDDSMQRYQVLSKNHIVKEFLDYAKLRETYLKFVEKPVKCKCSKSCLDRAMTEAREILNSERLEREQVEKERDSLVYLSDELCRVLLNYQRRALPDESKRKLAVIDESNQDSVDNVYSLSEYSNHIDESDSSSSSEISILESKDDVKDCNFYSNFDHDYHLLLFGEDTDEPIIVKEEITNDILYVSCTTCADESLEFSNLHFDPDDLSVQEFEVTELVSEVDEKHDSLKQLEISNISNQCLKSKNLIQQSYFPSEVSSLTSALTQSHLVPTPAENKSLLCDKCGKSFLGKNNNQCPICDTVSLKNHGPKRETSLITNTSKKPRRRRSTAVIGEVSDLHCDICDRHYSSRGSLKKHISAVHDRQKPYKCANCDKSFAAKCNLKIHSLLHSSRKPFKCSTCNECFKDPSSKRRHERTFHEEARYSCDHCDQRFFRKDKIAYHIKTEHSSESSKQCKCTICGKLFGLKHDLKSHIDSVHSSKMPYKCSICDKRFKVRKRIRQHEQRVHGGGVGFHCAYCGEEFFDKRNISKHLQNHR